MADSRSRPSPDLVAGVASRLREWLAPGRRLCVAYSGGRDSTALLHLAQAVAGDLGLGLEALHVHHGLSPHADAWADFCAAQCERLGIPLRIERVSVDAAAGDGIEAAARRARYAAYAACRADAIALAHHAGDQAETMLFRLLRGSAVAGAAGMPAQRRLAAGDGREIRLLRPLLDVAPEVLADFVAARQLVHVDDESNRDRGYSRNYLRHEILDPLARRFPGAVQRLARSAERLREADDLLAELAAIDLEACRGSRGLRLANLQRLSAARQRNLLHAWLRRQHIGVGSTAWLDELRGQLLGPRADAVTRVVIGDAEIRAWRGEAVVLRCGHGESAALAFDPRAGSIAWAGGVLTVAAGLGDGLAATRLERGPLRLARRRGGERLQPDPRRPRRALKQLLQEAAIPPWERELLPCLWCGDELAWVAGVGAAAAFVAGPGEPAWRLDWNHPEYADSHGSWPAPAERPSATIRGNSSDPV